MSFGVFNVMSWKEGEENVRNFSKLNKALIDQIKGIKHILLSRPPGRQGGTLIIARTEPTNSDELPTPSDVTFPVFGDDLRADVIRFFK
jgi:hypothetical protein